MLITLGLPDRIVAAVREGIAPQDPPGCHGTAFDTAVFFNGLNGIFRAAGDIGTFYTLHGGDISLIGTNAFNDHLFSGHLIDQSLKTGDAAPVPK